MSIESFRAASEAVESCVDALADAASFAEQENARAACGLLHEVGLKTAHYCDAIAAAADALAANPDGLLRLYGPAGGRVFNSAHEAVCELGLMLQIALPSPDGPEAEREAAYAEFLSRWCELLGSLNTSELRARIRRERALVCREFGEGKGEQDDKQEQPLPDAEWLGNNKVRVGKEVLILEEQLANVLQALVELRAATKPKLQKQSGQDEPGKLLKKMIEQFPVLAPHIRLPGGRGKGGYGTTITDAKAAPANL